MSDVLEALVQQGWKGPVDNGTSFGSRYVWADRPMFVKRPLCDCNDRPASLTVTCYESGFWKAITSYEVSLRFEKRGHWYDLKAYSLRTLDEIESVIPSIIEAGRAIAQDEPSDHQNT